MSYKSDGWKLGMLNETLWNSMALHRSALNSWSDTIYLATSYPGVEWDKIIPTATSVPLQQKYVVCDKIREWGGSVKQTLINLQIETHIYDWYRIFEGFLEMFVEFRKPIDFPNPRDRRDRVEVPIFGKQTKANGWNKTVRAKLRPVRDVSDEINRYLIYVQRLNIKFEAAMSTGYHAWMTGYMSVTDPNQWGAYFNTAYPPLNDWLELMEAIRAAITHAEDWAWPPNGIKDQPAWFEEALATVTEWAPLIHTRKHVDKKPWGA